MLDRVATDVYTGLRKEWRSMPWTVASVVMLWLIMVVVYWIIYPGLARSEDLTPINTRLQQIVIKQLDTEIMATYKDYCHADVKDYFAGRLIDLKRQYRTTTSDDYPMMPSCTELR
jgi:hypothetical protein